MKKRMKTKLCVFDCDGVLRTFSWLGIFEAYAAICEHFQIDFSRYFSSLEDFRKKYRHEWTENLIRIGVDKRDFPIANVVFFKSYDPHIQIFPWVDQALKDLSVGAIVAVLSNSDTASLGKTFNGKSQNISILVGSDVMPKLKPHPGGLQMIMREFGIGPRNTWMIGDSAVDIQTGKRAGTRTIAVGWGATESKQELLGLQADKFFHQPEDLVDFLKRQS